MRQAAQSLDTAQVPEDVFWYAQQVRRLPMPALSALQAFLQHFSAYQNLLAYPIIACSLI